MHDYIVEEVSYPSGGKLQIYKSGKRYYQPSQRYFEIKEKFKLELKSSGIPRTQRTIAVNRNKLLYQQCRCVSGEKLLDKLLVNKTKFDFTKEVLNKKFKYK